jgi:hypothetical protein
MAQTATHTPGPWFFAEDKHGNLTNLMRSGTGQYVLSPQCDVTEYGCRIDNYCDIQSGDAALIEAAPDLLASLKELVSTDASYHGNEVHLKAESLSEAIGRVSRARAAIAKAEGQP